MRLIIHSSKRTIMAHNLKLMKKSNLDKELELNFGVKIGSASV